jgi:hypothetical protein
VKTYFFVIAKNSLIFEGLNYFFEFYGALWDTFNAAMNATLGCDSTQASALFFLAYANGENARNKKIY